MPTKSHSSSLFEIDRELDLLLDEINDQTETDGTDQISPELTQRFEEFCRAYSDKIDRIGSFLTLIEARALHCRSEAARLAERARSSEGKAERTRNMVLYYLESRNLPKIEGLEFTLRRQKNSQDSVLIRDEPQVPVEYREIEAKVPGRLWQVIQAQLSDETKKELGSCVRHMKPSAEAIKAAAVANETVPGAEVRRGVHLRVA